MGSKPNGNSNRINYIHPSHTSAWKVTDAETGFHIRANNPPLDNILCRVASGHVYLYDRDRKAEVGINIASASGHILESIGLVSGT